MLLTVAFSGEGNQHEKIVKPIGNHTSVVWRLRRGTGAEQTAGRYDCRRRAVRRPAKRTYEQYLKQQRVSLEEGVKAAAGEGYRLNYIEDFGLFVSSREEFERRESFAGYECRKIKYLSGGLKVAGFIWKPKNVSGKKLPLVIVNRGGNPSLSLLTPQSFYYPYVVNGFAVVGSQYRGADGGEGEDEFGGEDVDDVLNLIPLARSLGYVDMNNVFMHRPCQRDFHQPCVLRCGLRGIVARARRPAAEFPARVERGRG